MASTSLSRTMGTSTSELKHTCSMWLKRSGLGTEQFVWMNREDGSNRTYFRFNSTDTIAFKNEGGSSVDLQTTQKFRDVGAWYNIVIAIDTTQATSSNRVKIYINGVQITSFSDEVYPSQNAVFSFNNVCSIGSNGDSSLYFDGFISYVSVVDGTQELPTAFGSVDSASGIWKVNTSPSVTYGTNGFFLKMDTSSPGSDTSGNNNTFTASGTPTLAEDNCSNNLVTMNPLDNYRAASTFSNGNNTIVSNGSNNTYNTSTIGIASGKFYSEVKVNTNNDNVVGIAGQFSGSSTAKLEDGANNYGYVGYDGTVMNNGSTLATYGTYTTGDIIGIAVDCTNNKFYVSKNGVFQGSADPSNNTGGLSITAAASVVNNVYMFAGGENSGARTVTHNWNFGNGFFGVTAVASSNADAAGHGLFEYAVPTGFYTLNTKNLNTYGG